MEPAETAGPVAPAAKAVKARKDKTVSCQARMGAPVATAGRAELRALAAVAAKVVQLEGKVCLGPAVMVAREAAAVSGVRVARGA